MRSLLFLLLLALLGPGCDAQPRPQPQFRLGRTTGIYPYLKYGLGEDRLGGAKMGYIDTNLVVRIEDSVKDDYKVRLSQYHAAYIPKVFVKADTSVHARPYYLTQNFKVYGDTGYDFVSIAVDEKLPYRAYQEINPSRLILEIFGATSNTNWITQLSSCTEIKNVYYEQPEDDLMKVIIDLKHPQHWGHHIYYDSTGRHLIVRIKPQPVSPDIKNLRIAIDPGHGGDNKGADGDHSPISEKVYTLIIAKQLEQTLKAAGVKNVFMTRTKDTTLSMPERFDLLAAWKPDVLVSIHLNSSSTDTTRGVSTYYRYIGFRPLTQALLKQLLAIGLNEYGNVGNFNFALSGPTEYPNALVELAFLSNRGDEQKILNPAFRKQACTAIMKGIQDWLRASVSGTQPADVKRKGK